MIYYKVPAGTKIIVFYRLWSGENAYDETTRNAYFTETDIHDFGENGPDDMVYFMLPINKKKILAIGVEERLVLSMDRR